MNLTDLKQLSPQQAVEALCQCDDETLDRLAAEARGWRKEDVVIDSEFKISVYFNKNYSVIQLHDWSPSNDLNQAYELLGKQKIARHWSYSRQEYSIWIQRRRHESDMKLYDESQAGSHARAVVILAIVGLVIGGGA